MPFANWKSQVYNVVQSLLFNNPHRVIDYRVRDDAGRWRSRSEMPAPVRRLFETEASPEGTCPLTIQFVHHMLIPPGQEDGRPVKVRANIEANFRLIREMATQEPSTTGQP